MAVSKIIMAGPEARPVEAQDGLMASSSPGSAFVRIDDTPDEVQQQLINYLDGVAAHQETQRVRTIAFEMFAPAAGERLLEAGCGIGEVARQLGSRVGASGTVEALDRSEKVISVARSRDNGNHVRYSVGDVTALDFPDGHFDGVRCERVLQHLPDPDAAINEFTRVVRPGGRVCVIDTDWSSLVWDGFEYLDEAFECLDELTGSIRTMGDDRMAGRAIRSRMVRAGLRETTVFPVTVRFTSPTDAAVVSAVFDRSAMKERLPGELFDRFFASLDQSADRGDFLFAVTMWICVGRVAS